MKFDRYIFLDTETTGLNPLENSLLEVGAVIVDEYEDGNKVEVCRLIMNIHPLTDAKGPLYWGPTKIDLAALALNGYTAKSLREEALIDPKDSAATLADFLVTYVTPGSTIIACNPEFDITFIKSFLTQNGYEAAEILGGKYADRNGAKGIKYKSVDLANLAWFIHNAGYIELEDGKPSLDNICKALGISAYANPVLRHSALYDTLLAMKAFFELRDIISPEEEE